MTWEPIASIAITVLLVVGVAMRKRVKLHVPCMWGVIVCDVALLLWVETQGQAIKRVVGGEIPLSLKCHVGFAVALIIGYIVAAVAGIILFKNRQSPIRKLHRINGGTVVAVRFGLLITTPGLFFPPLPT